MKVLTVTFLLAILLSACSSSPPRVEASRSMIKYDQVLESAQLVPEPLWVHLEQKNVNDVTPYNDVEITFRESYFSALGLQCRKIYISKVPSKNTNRFERVSCKSNSGKSWYLISNVIDNNNKIELGN
ncbi:hypothetical protein L2735_09385 [Shewanella olleyana]|uniref:hypothetical protein n=1 Tax=Shewanella olleyana TaxID=135626 RepID=UPI00200FFC50|nr:hypothetical protein [Shewanella olleyana]MCL1067018.1 hypothetical protein [Shewanella olleyana]